MKELNMQQVAEVSGGVNGGGILLGLLAGAVGAGLAVAGLGTPISIAGAVLAVEGATLIAVSIEQK